MGNRKIFINFIYSFLNVDATLILGTGFMGKVFVEKLLRLTDVGKIYMLMRVKKGKNPKERLVDTFSNPVRKCLRIHHVPITHEIENFH